MWFNDNYIKNLIYINKKENGNSYFLWNIHFNVTKRLPKTSNSLEGWHMALNALVSHKNSSLFELLEKLQKEQNTSEIKILQSLVQESKFNGFVSSCEDCCLKYETFYGVDFLLKIAILLKLKFE
jgi:uncharacterized protein YihD (DUF1040 family)